MLITVFYQFWPEGHWEPFNESASLSPAEHLVGFKIGTFWFWLQRLNPLGHLWQLRLWHHNFYVIKKIWSHDPSYFVDVVVWPKFGNSSISVRELITSILYTIGRGILGVRAVLKVFWNKVYDVIISFNDATNKISSRDSNYILDAVMWPKFGNSSSFMRKVIITSIL